MTFLKMSLVRAFMITYFNCLKPGNTLHLQLQRNRQKIEKVGNPTIKG